MTQLQSSSVVVCNVARMYVPSGLKAISIEAAVAMINIFISLFGTQANGLVIMAYYRNPRLRTIQNTIFLLLAITDFNVTAFVEPIYVVAILDSFLENCGCVLWDVNIVLAMLFVELSLVTSVILSLQTYITLAYPYHYQTIITKSRLIITITLSVFFILCTTFSVLWHRNLFFYGPPTIIVVAIVTVVFTWCRTCKLVAPHRRAIQTTHTPSASQNISRRQILYDQQ